ncbi:MAG: hypothetical protein JSW51_03030 [Gemmatimonadota bacterium]|nr:MAG: hypothetical protein JSW51_03030 [Gemmatimonadota bacterium]
MATEYTYDLNTILRDTIPQLPGVVRAVAERELRQTIREFFERTYAWRTVIEGVDAPAGDTPRLLSDANDGDTNSDVIGILRIVYNGVVLSPLPFKVNRVETGDLPTNFYMTSNPDEFKLHPQLQNASTGLMDIHVALTPKDSLDLTTFPRQIGTKFYDAIIEGFLARMYMHPNKPYSQPALGSQMRHNFRRRMGYYMSQAKAGYNDAASWGYPRGWSPRRPGMRNGA